jgi:hypothetical protein
MRKIVGAWHLASEYNELGFEQFLDRLLRVDTYRVVVWFLADPHLPLGRRQIREPLGSHSLASGLIENFAAAEDFTQEAVTEFDPLLDFPGRANNEI